MFITTTVTKCQTIKKLLCNVNVIECMLKWRKILGKTILLIHKTITPIHAVCQKDPIAFKSYIDIL